MTNRIDALVVTELTPNEAVAATENGVALNIRRFIGRLGILLHSLAGTGTTPTLNVTIEDSPDGSTGWLAISGAAFAEVDDTAGGSHQTITIDANAARPFIRAVSTIAGGTPSFTYGTSIYGRPDQG